MSDTDWIKPGVEVIVHTYGAASFHEHVSKDVIKKVATKSFSLEGADGRYGIHDTRRMGGDTWGPVTYVYPLDSDKARAVIAVEDKRRRVHRADRAIDEWRKTHTPDARAAAIAALQAVED